MHPAHYAEFSALSNMQQSLMYHIFQEIWCVHAALTENLVKIPSENLVKNQRENLVKKSERKFGEKIREKIW